MTQRTLFHLLLLAVVAAVIFLFPEMRGSQSLANYDADRAADEEVDLGAPRNNPLDSLADSLGFPGIRGEVIGPDGAPVGGVLIEAVPLLPPADALEAGARPPSATSEADGGFDLFCDDLNSVVTVRSQNLALIFQALGERADASTSVLLVVAPTAPVAGRVLGANAGQRVLLRATHSLPRQAQASGNSREVDFVRELPIQADGSFDFGRVPCSATTTLETKDAEGAPRRASVPVEGTLTAVIDLRGN